jgi:hypothetical protein
LSPAGTLFKLMLFPLRNIGLIMYAVNCNQ